jgi:hypothetical protein
VLVSAVLGLRLPLGVVSESATGRSNEAVLGSHWGWTLEVVMPFRGPLEGSGPGRGDGLLLIMRLPGSLAGNRTNGCTDGRGPSLGRSRLARAGRGCHDVHQSLAAG